MKKNTIYRNRLNACKHFYPEGNGKIKTGYCLHHIDDRLKHDYPDRYNEWRIEDLVMITSEEHTRLHHTGKSALVSEVTRHKMSIASRGIPKSEEHKQNIFLASPTKRKINCITTGEVFESARIASIKYNIPQSNICKCCQGNRNYAGKLPDGRNMIWRY